MKAASDLTQERLTVVEISGSDGGSYRHRGELEVTQSTRAGRGGLGDTRADRFGLNWDFRFASPIFNSPCRPKWPLSARFKPVLVHGVPCRRWLPSRLAEVQP